MLSGFSSDITKYVGTECWNRQKSKVSACRYSETPPCTKFQSFKLFTIWLFTSNHADGRQTSSWWSLFGLSEILELDFSIKIEFLDDQITFALLYTKSWNVYIYFNWMIERLRTVMENSFLTTEKSLYPVQLGSRVV